MWPTEFQRGYTDTRFKLENLKANEKDWVPQHIKELARNQKDHGDYDKGAEEAVIDYQHGLEWKY